MPEPTIKEIAQRIQAHLQRFERDPAINAPTRNEDGTVYGDGSIKLYWNARAFQVGGYIRIVYVSYQDGEALRRPAAVRYLEWLDAGNVGTHHEALR